MAAISLLSGVAMVWVFGKVSDQKTIKVLREQIRGNLIGVRLFQSDIRVILRLQSHIFSDTFRYMRLALVPMFVLILPIFLIMAQLNLRFAVRPLLPGETAIVKALVRDSATLNGPLKLATNNGIVIETPPVRIEADGEVVWRIRAKEIGKHRLVLHIGNESLDTHVVTGHSWSAVPQLRTGRGAIESLLYPGAPPIADTHAVEAIEISYPELNLEFLGVNTNWLITFFVLSMGFGFAFKGRLGVEL